MRHMTRRAGTVALLMRHCATILVAVVMVIDPSHTAAPTGIGLLTALSAWSLYRLLTRSQTTLATGIDFAATLLVCLAIPLLVADPGFYRSNCAPVAIVGTAVVTYGISLPTRVSLAMTATIAGAYAYGAAQVVGWSGVPDIFNLYYFGLQWAASVVMRLTVVRVATAVDAARQRRQRAEIVEQVGAAVRAYDREQTRLLHDTVASTLLLVGQGTPLPAERLAAQAGRDLQILGEGPAPMSTAPIELVTAVKGLLPHLITPAVVTGVPTLWLDSTLAQPIIAATREALTNVDRHAMASVVTVDIQPERVVITDDGNGFDPRVPSSRHGLAASVIGRMTHLGGHATVTSSPGNGTSIQLSWRSAPVQPPATDPDRLLERTRIGYSLVITAYAVLNLAIMLPVALVPRAHPAAQIMLAITAALCTLSAVPAIFEKSWAPTVISSIVLMGVALIQTMLVPADLIGGQVQWSQNATGWCLMPLLVRQPQARARTLLAVYWFVPAALSIARSPTAHTFLNIGLGTASILTVQLCVLLFNTLINDAALHAQAETASRLELLTRKQVTQALQDEYRRRYSDLIANIRPLLSALRDGNPIDAAFRQRAKVETQRMRVLFDQSASFDHPLLRALRPAIDTAEARQVDVSLHTEGRLPPMTPADVESIASVLRYALDLTDESARIALSAEPDGMTASIVGQGMSGDLTQHSELPNSAVELTVFGDSAWLTVRYRVRHDQRSDAQASVRRTQSEVQR